MDTHKKCLQDYLEKINFFIACLKCKNWIAAADEKALDTIFNCAFEIHGILLKDESKNLKKALEIFYPEFNFSRCGDEVLKALLLHPAAEEKMMLHATKRYIAEYSKKHLSNLLRSMFDNESLKDQSLCLIDMLSQKENLLKMIEAKSAIYVWETMIAENNENFENSVKDIFENETSSFLYYLQLSPESTGHAILTVVLKHLSSQPDLRLWFILLNSKNIKTTSFLCGRYPEFLKELLEFFSKYASEPDCQEGETFNWIHNNYPLHQFVDILNFLLMNDGKVGIAVNEYINKQINNFDENFSFWVDVKTLLL